MLASPVVNYSAAATSAAAVCWQMPTTSTLSSFWNSYPKIQTTAPPICGGFCGPQTGCNTCSLNV